MTNAYSLGSVDVALTPLARFEEFLQSRDKRITKQRRILVEHIFAKHEHFDADTLIAELVLSEETRQVSRPTVYRTLAELVDAGLLRKMDLGGRAVYEHDYGYPDHDHLYCKECERLFEFHSDELVKIRDAVARDRRFRVTGHRFIVSGICEECSRARKRPATQMDRI